MIDERRSRFSPLENIARGVPAAFAAMVRKLMAKTPHER